MYMYIFLASAVTAMAVENPVFARALGTSRESLFIDGARSGILLGAAFTWMAFWSSLFVAFVNNWLLAPVGGFLTAGAEPSAVLLAMRPVLYLAGVALVYGLSVKVLLAKLKFGGYSGKLREMAPLVTFNTALFGAFFIANSQNFSAVQTIGYAVGSGVGYTGAVLVIYLARRQLALSTVPRAFRGLPVLLVYMGLISLALYGLIGQILPT